MLLFSFGSCALDLFRISDLFLGEFSEVGSSRRSHGEPGGARTRALWGRSRRPFGAFGFGALRFLRDSDFVLGTPAWWSLEPISHWHGWKLKIRNPWVAQSTKVTWRNGVARRPGSKANSPRRKSRAGGEWSQRDTNRTFCRGLADLGPEPSSIYRASVRQITQLHSEFKFGHSGVVPFLKRQP